MQRWQRQQVGAACCAEAATAELPTCCPWIAGNDCNAIAVQPCRAYLGGSSGEQPFRRSGGGEAAVLIARKIWTSGLSRRRWCASWSLQSRDAVAPLATTFALAASSDPRRLVLASGAQ